PISGLGPGPELWLRPGPVAGLRAGAGVDPGTGASLAGRPGLRGAFIAPRADVAGLVTGHPAVGAGAARSTGNHRAKGRVAARQRRDRLRARPRDRGERR